MQLELPAVLVESTVFDLLIWTVLSGEEAAFVNYE
jgi:hypothetical protein